MKTEEAQCDCQACREEAALENFTESVNKLFLDLDIKLHESKVVALIDVMASLGATVQVAHGDDGETIMPPKFMIDTSSMGAALVSTSLH